jgi:hypothetical protein
MKKYSKKAAGAANRNLRDRETKEFTLLPIKELRNMHRMLFNLSGNEPEALFINGRYLYV